MPKPQYVRRSYGGGSAVAQLVNAMGSTDTSFTISPTTGWVDEDGSSPLGTVGPFTVVIDRFTPQVEKILCSSINLSTGVVTVYTSGDGWSGRGYDGTTAQAHVPNGSTAGVQTCWSSQEADEANQAVVDVLGGGLTTYGVPVGTIVPFAGTPQTLPTNFLVADGSSVLRASYSALFSALTVNGTCTSTASSATLTGISSAVTPFITAGMALTLTNSGGAVYTVSSVTSTQIVLTSGTGVTAGTGAFIVYPHGASDSTHFNLPDARSRVIAGQSNGVSPTNAQPALWVGGTGGESLHTLAQNELSTAIGTAAAQSVSDPGHNHIPLGPASQFVYTYTPSTLYAAASAYAAGGAGTTTSQITFESTTANASTGITLSASAVTNAGGGNAHENKQPYLVATHIIRAQ